MKNHKCLLISDFNIENLAAYLKNSEGSSISVEVSPYGQVAQILMQKNLCQSTQEYDVVVVWTQPQSVSQSFLRALSFEKISHDEILKEIDEYCALLIRFAQQTNYMLVPSLVMPTYQRGYGALDMRDGIGLQNVLHKINIRIAENVKSQKNIFILNTQRWVELAGVKAFNPKMWYMAKIAFGNEVFQHATDDIESFLKSVSGQYRKLVIVDLDDTLWGGVIGDEGIADIKLGGHDHLGESFVDFQKALKGLTRKGILLGIVSKNNEDIALEAINKHPEMILKESDFAGWRINWNDKAQNIIDLAAELNLGLQSVVFIDDNPVERARVSDALPEVYVPEWPKDKMLYAKALFEMSCFDIPELSQEDLDRSAMYVSERERKEFQSLASSYDEWLKTLDLKVQVEEVNSINIQRIAQLLNKTNQMNLMTRRLSEEALKAWNDEDNHWLWAIRVSDKFGDSGLTGIVSLDVQGNKGRVVDFILSCRVMGRKIEETMLYILWSHAKQLSLTEIYADYVKTAKNQPCFDFFKNSGLTYDESTCQFTQKIVDGYALPSLITLGNLSFCYES